MSDELLNESGEGAPAEVADETAAAAQPDPEEQPDAVLAQAAPVAEPPVAEPRIAEPTVAELRGSEPVATEEPLVVEELAPVAPRPMSLAAPVRFTGRFAFFYALLGAVGIGSLAALVVFVLSPAIRPAAAWSSWSPPSGSTAAVQSAIASHVAQQYRLNKSGAELLAVISGPLQVTSGTSKVAVPDIAVFTTPTSSSYNIFSSSGTWTDQLCGLGPTCSISSGQATNLRGQLVRREALELALYTFKFDPSINSLITYMPPPPGSAAGTVLYFQKSNLQKQLSEPLVKTLPLIQPPLPTVSDAAEKATIDKLTLQSVYSFKYGALQAGGAVLELDPVLP
jgi:hypothetical protein